MNFQSRSGNRPAPAMSYLSRKHTPGLLRFCSRHELLRRLPCGALCNSRLRYMVEDRHSGEATSSRIQPKEEKALSSAIRSLFLRSTRLARIRETPLLQPISSGPVQLAIHTDLQSVCLEFAGLKIDRLPPVNLVSRFDLNLWS